MTKKILCVIVLLLGFVCIFASCDNGNNDGKNDQTANYEAKFNDACTLIEDGEYEDAYEILSEIKDYAPAKEKLNNFFYAPTLIQAGSVVSVSGSNLGETMKYNDFTYSYNANGNIRSITIEEYGKTFEFKYDSKGNELQGYRLDAPNSADGARTCIYKNGKLSKVSYADKTEEYEYNSYGYVKRVIYTTKSSSREVTYTYKYYEDDTVKSMKYVNGHYGYEYLYDTDGNVTKVLVYDNQFSEAYGYYSIKYGDYGVNKVKVIRPDDSGEESVVGELNYTYDKKGRLIEVMAYYEEELEEAFLLSGYKLYYSENENTKDRISIINQTAIESIIKFFR